MASREEVNTERRLKLDGGINSRDGYFATRPDQCTALQNFRLITGGSLQVRDGSSVAPGDNAIFLGPGSVSDTNIVTLAVAAGGALAAGTYNFIFVARIRTGGQAANKTKVTFNNTFTYVGVTLNQKVVVTIVPNNLGEGVGQNAGIVDDPFMGGFVSGEVEIFCKKTGDPNFTLQGTTFAFTYSAATRTYTTDFTTYTTNGAVFPGPTEVAQTMIRSVKSWGEFNRFYIVIGDTLWSLNAKRYVGSINASYGTDKNGKKHYLSRTPTPISMAFVSHVPILTDGFRAKKLADTSTLALDGQSELRLLGANPPTSGPTLAVGAAGVPNGTYFYKVTLVYRLNRSTIFPANGVSGVASWDSESNSSVANSVVVANQRVTVGFPAGLLVAESGLQFIRVYRTKAGGTTFFKLTDVVSPFAGFTDNAADSTLITTKTPPDDIGKDPCDLPPQQALFLTEHQGLGWCVAGNAVTSTTSGGLGDRVIAIVGTNIVRVSKLMLIAGQSDESTIDHWPNTVNYTVVCGGTSRITALLSHRGQLYVFKDDEIGIILGDQPGNFYYRTITSGTGAIAGSVVAADSSIYFWNSSKAAFRFDGTGLQHLGNLIQYQWEADEQNFFWCYGSYYDSFTNEVKWIMTDMPTDPAACQIVAGQGNAAAVRGNWKEYVLYLGTEGWTVYQGTSFYRNVCCGDTVDVIQPTTQKVYATQKLALLGNSEGRVFYDHSGFTDLGQPISAFAEFSPFVGPNPETVKLWKKLMMSWAQVGPNPTQGNIVVKAKFAEATNFTTLSTIPYTTLAIGQRMDVIDIPTALSPPVSNDRGLLVRVESTLDTTWTLAGLFAQWRDITSVRKSVGH